MKTKERDALKIAVFFILSCLFSWALWLPTVLSYNGMDMPKGLLVASSFATFAPSLVAFFMIVIEVGRDGSLIWIKNQVNKPFQYVWIPVAILIFPIIAAVSYNLTLAAGSGIESEWIRYPAAIFPMFVQILIFGGALGEELGWRGYALNRLLKHTDPIKASLILGIVWSIWQIPLFFVEGTIQNSIPIVQFFLMNMITVFFYTWIYMKVKGNIVVMIFLHGIADISLAVFSYWQTEFGRYVGLGVSLLFLGLILFNDEAIGFSSTTREDKREDI